MFSSFFSSEEDRICYLWKVQNVSFSVISKQGSMLYKTSTYHFFQNWKIIFFWFLKYHKRSFYQLLALEKVFFYSQKPIISNFSLSKKFMVWTFPFFLTCTFISWKVVFVIILFLLNILKWKNLIFIIKGNVKRN